MIKVHMKCSNPVIALRLPVKTENGKDTIKILSMSSRPDWNIRYLEDRYGKDNILKLPCGKCESCKEAKKEDWAIRCDMEARMYLKNAFITLTYRDECLPRYLSKGHLRRFIKRIINHDPDVKYFGCGEYGELNGRPHYHLLLFGFFPDDAFLKVGVQSKSGFEIYESKILEKLWNKGFVEVQTVSVDAAFYVSGYVNKKTGIDDGFLIHSKGLGFEYMKQHFDELKESRCYVSKNGYVHFLPRAFKRLSERLGLSYEDDPELKVLMRKAENSEMVQRKLENREELFSYQSKKMKDKLSRRLNRL